MKLITAFALALLAATPALADSNGVACTLKYRVHSDMYPKFNTEWIPLEQPAQDLITFTASNGETYQASASNAVQPNGHLYLSAWFVGTPMNFVRPGAQSQLESSGDDVTLFVYGQARYMTLKEPLPGDNTVVILSYNCKR